MTLAIPFPSVIFQPTRVLLSWALSGVFGWVASSTLDAGESGGGGGDSAAALVYGALRAVGVAFAVYLVGNMGWHAGDFKAAFRGAMVGVAATLLGFESPIFNIGFLASYVAFSRTRRWKTPGEYAAHVDGGALAWIGMHAGSAADLGTKQQHGGLCVRAKRLALVVLLGATAITSGLYHHGAITAKADDGTTERVRFKDCIRHILNSPAWKEFSFFEAYERFQSSDSYGGGWERFSEFVKESSDLTGKKNARKVLGVDRDASLKEVKSAHRTLALKLHPDRCAEEGCEARFTEMQAAYELLKGLEDKRKRRRERRERREPDGSSNSEEEGEKKKKQNNNNNNKKKKKRKKTQQQKKQKKSSSRDSDL